MTKLRYTKSTVRKLQYIVLFGLIIYVAGPLLWAITGAFKEPSDLFASPPPIIFFNIDFDQIVRLWSNTNYPTYFMNSVIVGVVATLLTSALATLAGYGLTRSSFRGKQTLARSILFMYMIPTIFLALPLYSLFYNIHLLNTYFALVMAHTAIALPFGIWIMWQYFQTIPIAYEESAWLDGASIPKTIWDVALPLASPGAIAVSIFSFALSWNDFTFALVIMSKEGKKTLPFGVSAFIEQTGINWGMVLAAALFIMLPAFLLILFLQKYLLEGFSVTGFE